MSDVRLGAAKIFESLCCCYPMTTTPNPHAIDLTKGTDVPESTRLLFKDPHVPSFHTMRTVVSEASNLLVEHTNLIYGTHGTHVTTS